MSFLTDKVNGVIKGEKLDGHAQRNIESRAAAIALKEEVIRQLTKEDVLEIVYRACPSYGELMAFTSLLRKGVMSLDDIRHAQKKSKLFSNVNEINDIDGSSIMVKMRHTLDTLEGVYKLATHPDSPDGEDIDDDEYDLLNDFHIELGFKLAESMAMIDMKYKRNKKNK